MADPEFRPATKAEGQEPPGPSPTARDGQGGTMSLGDPLPPAPAPSPLPVIRGPLPRIEGFEVLAELARGGMGVVYKARQLSLNRIVALKMIRAGELAAANELMRFRVEAEAVARIQHPNVVQIHEINEHEGRPFLCLEFVEGGSLDKVFAGKPQPARPLAALLETLARAMHVVHEHGIIHRDLKPANILLSGERAAAGKVGSATASLSLACVPKIGDFGLAKRLIENERGLTPTHAIMGTPEYMAPEQAAGTTKAIGPHTDVYALGAILYEGLTGRPPFSGNSWMETLQMVMIVQPTLDLPPSADLPRDLQTICLKCLSKDPAARYPSAQALADDLHRFLTGAEIHARPPGIVERGTRWIRRHWAAGALAGLFSALVAVVIIMMVSRTPPEPLAKLLPPDSEVRAKAAALRKAMAASILKTSERTGWIQYNPDPAAAPVPDMWTHAQGLAGLLANADATPEQLRKLLPMMDIPFAPGQRIEVDGFKYGWPALADSVFARSDPALWTVCFVSKALAKPQFLTADERKLWLTRLDEVQEILRNYRPPQFQGAWNPVPRQTNPDHVSCYVTTLALFALTDVKAAELPWEGSTLRRDQLLKETAQWLIAHFQDGNPAGWRAHPFDRLDPIYDGLTLKIYAALLRAESQGLIEIPPAIARHIPRHLAACATRTLDYPPSTIVEGLSFTAPSGQVLKDVNYSARAQWYPWAIVAASLWLQKSEKAGLPPEELLPVRRALAHFIIDVGDEALLSMKSLQTFVTAETLYALAAVPLPEAAGK